MYNPNTSNTSSQSQDTKDFLTSEKQPEENDEPLEEQVFLLPRGHVPQAYLDLSNTDMASMDIHLPESNVGYKLLTKMGWKAGQGLGSLQQGRKEPIRIDTKSDCLGVGKLEEENFYHVVSTAKRKALDSEKIAEETEEERQQRENKVQKQESIKKELEIINSAFYCALCDKQYTKITEYETHLSSYDHNHRKRFKEMKETINRPVAKLDKKREKERKREEKEMARLQQAALQKVGNKSSFAKGSVDDDITCTETIKSTSTVNSKTNGGWVSSVETDVSTSTDCTQNGPSFVRATSNTSGWSSSTSETSGWNTLSSSGSTKPNVGGWTLAVTSIDTQSVPERSENVDIVIDNKTSAENNSSKSKFTFGIGKPALEQSEVCDSLLSNI
ncbi:13944_t:CDS:2 [Dentiscutata erythropus]|uniref:13944_t:CDS:1 n=1 Tax=Dentiscutata erythropus TaxID=1348616 RepID=A0A9N8VI43_9GLOM|nr:13944_t:CDS:2 [Dentiscutata erythropus]